MTGRPTIWTEERGEAICELVADGKSLRTISKMDGMPSIRTLTRWLREGDHPFRPQLHETVEGVIDQLHTDLLELVDEHDGEDDAVQVARARLRVQTRIGILERLRKSTWSKRTDIDLAGAGVGPGETRRFTLEIVSERAPGADDDPEREPEAAHG